MLTDSHCHLASHKFPPEEIPELIERAGKTGVTKLISLATSLDDIDSNLAIADAHPEVHCCVGIHPCDVHHAPDNVIELLKPRLSDPRVCAVGETGLDYFHPAPEGWTQESFRNRQRKLLDAHFIMAAEAGLNVVIHTRDCSGDASFQDALEIYRRHASTVRAVFHCFISTIQNARDVVDLGGLVSFGGVATFKNATEVLEVATSIPVESLMLETDSPYLAPHPFRGQRNEPSHVRTVAEKIAEARDLPIETLADATSRAAIGFFRGIE